MNNAKWLVVAGFSFVCFSCGSEAKERMDHKNVNSIKTADQSLPNLGKYEMFYAVKEGDDLYKIAKNADVKVEWLIKRNRIISPSDIVPGKEIIIPTP